MSRNKWLITVFVVLALLGFTDATYLMVEHLRGVIPPCTVVKGCDIVLTSKYAIVGGVPVAALGMLYYGTLLVMLIAFIDTNNVKLLRLAGGMTVLGLLSSGYFLAIQMFALHSYCFYCLISAGISALLSMVGMAVIWIYRQAITV